MEIVLVIGNFNDNDNGIYYNAIDCNNGIGNGSNMVIVFVSTKETLHNLVLGFL